MDEKWFDNAFQIFEATDENDLEIAMVVLRGGTNIGNDEEEEDSSSLLPDSLPGVSYKDPHCGVRLPVFV